MNAPRHLYVHVPFCARRCTYCDFAIAVRSHTPVTEYTDALALELARTVNTPLHLKSLYLGGGTPSRLGGDGVAGVMTMLQRYVTLDADAEVTLEANPDDVTREAALAWRDAGINRVSLGVQSFDPHVLQWMHRTHSAQQARDAVATLRAAGIANVSLDLIFALPPSLHRQWAPDVQQAIALEPSHVSLYGLTVEPHTPLGRWRERGDLDETPDENYEADFLVAHELLSAAGFDHYEVSNYGRPGQHARHNSAYWDHVPYAAAGPAAHRFDGQTRSWNVPHYTEWMHRLQSDRTVVQEEETLTSENRAAERVYLGLRVQRGLAATDAELAVARRWVDAGWAAIRDRTIVLSPTGWLRLDALAASLTVAERR